MSLLAVWIPEEDQPRLWMASDSRLSSNDSVLLDEGVKLFEVPVVCRKPSSSGFFDEVYYASKLGLGCVGGSLIYHQVHATLLPLLTNLIGGGAIPSISQLADFTAAVANRYVQSLGARQPTAAQQVQFVLGGYCPVDRAHVAFLVRPELQNQLVSIVVRAIDLTAPYFGGDDLARAQALYREMVAATEPGVSASRAPLNVIRQLITADDAPTIGGDVQIGFTVGAAFQRAQTCLPIPGEEPRAAFWLNAICVDELPPPGPCAIGLMGSIGP